MHKALRLAILLLLSLCAAVPGHALDALQSVRFEHFTVAEGLPDNTVRTIVQDRAGFLWFGTQSGLVRYDGYDMKVFLPDPADSTSIGGRIVNNLLLDARGDLWIGSLDNGVACYGMTTGRFRNWFPEGPEATALPSRMVGCMAEDPEGGIWVGFVNSPVLARIDPASGEVRTMAPAPDSDDRDVLTIFVDRTGMIWTASSGGGLLVRNRQGRTVRRYQSGALLPDMVIMGLLQADENRLWLLGRQGLMRFDPATEQVQTWRPDPEEPTGNLPTLERMARAPDGSIWIAAHTSLLRFQPEVGTFVRHAHDPLREDSMPKGPGIAVHVDRTGVVWLGTWHAGLVKHDPNANRFDYYSTGSSPGLPPLPITAVAGVLVDHAGRLWVGTGTLSATGPQGGLQVLDRRSGTFRPLEFPSPEVRSVVDIVEAGPDTLWIGTNHGLWQCLPRQGILRQPDLVIPHADLLRNRFIRSVYRDSRGVLWVNSQGMGLLEFDPASGHCRLFKYDADDPSSLSQNTAPVVLEDSAGRIWVGTDVAGLNLFEPETGTFRRFFAPQSGLVNVTDLLEGSDGRLWLGTIAGLLSFDPERGQVVDIIGRAQGLPNDMVGSILAADDGHLWLSTGRGLVDYDPAQRSMRVFDRLDGLPSEGIHFAHHRGIDGTLYFGGPNGLLKFHPQLVNRRSSANPPVALTEIRLFDRPLQPGPDTGLDCYLPCATRLDLPWDRNQLTFVFSALDFTRPDRNRYRYMLAGHDPDWRRSGPDRTAVYTKLPPGRYRFRVQATNSEGVWSGNEVDFAVRIGHPWWASPVAFVMYVVAGLMALALGFHLATRRIKLAADLRIRMAELGKLRELDTMKSRFFANISHEFRTPLTLILGPLDRLVREPEAGETELFAMMRRNARRLGQLIDQLLDLSRLESRHFPLNWQPLDAFGQLRVLAASFQSLAEVEGLEYHTEIPTGPAPCLADPDLLEKVTANLLTNALKFAASGSRIWLTASLGPEMTVQERAAVLRPDNAHLYRVLRIEVGNTGSYIPPAEQEKVFERFYQTAGEYRRSRRGSGIGLALIRELADLLGGRAGVVSDREAGTVFTVELPVFATDTPVPLDQPFSLDKDGALLDLSGSAPGGIERPDRETAGSSPLLLVVEDDPDLRNFLFDILRHDFRIILAADGEEGLETAFTEVPDLIVSDVMMPGRDGLELCDAVKKDERTSHIPVVLLTARTESESRIAGLETGADSYLAKPFEPRVLLAQVRNLIEQRRHLRERWVSTLKIGPLLAPDGGAAIESADTKFLQRIRAIARDGIEDTEFSVVRFAREVGMSRSQLHRKLTALTGLSTSAFLRTVRLHRAAELLRAGYGNVTEVAFATGHKSLSHFSKCFREEFGLPPSEYPPAD